MLTPKEQQDKCPQCDKNPTANRWKAGVKQLICGNGHNWAFDPLKDLKKKEADKQETGFYTNGPLGGFFKYYQK